MKNLIVALALMTTFATTIPAAEAMPKGVRFALKWGTYIPCVVLGFKVGTIVGPVVGACVGVLTAERTWAIYWAEKERKAKEAEAAK